MKVCKVDGCQGEHRARGYCGKHYYQARARGEFADIRLMGRVGCAIEECNRGHYSMGYCRKHYAQFNRTGSPLVTRQFMRDRPECEVDGCEEKHVAEGLCQYHYDFKRRTGYDLRQMPELLDHIRAIEQYDLKVGKERAQRKKLL